MQPRDRRRRRGGTALLAAFAIVGLTAALGGCGVGNSAGERTAERAVTSSTAQGVDGERRPVAYIAYIPEIPRPPEPLADDWRMLLRLHEVMPAVKEWEIELLKPLKDDRLRPEKAHRVIELACKAYDLHNVAQAKDLDEAINKSITAFGGAVMRPARTVELVNEVREARSSNDRIRKIAVFLLCEGNAEAVQTRH